MTKRNFKWMIRLIDRMLDQEIGDSTRLNTIKSQLKDSKTIYDDDDVYFFQKLKELENAILRAFLRAKRFLYGDFF